MWNYIQDHALKNVLHMPQELQKVVLSRGVRQPAVDENDSFFHYIHVYIIL